jgi:hypothetical protein
MLSWYSKSTNIPSSTRAISATRPPSWTQWLEQWWILRQVDGRISCRPNDHGRLHRSGARTGLTSCSRSFRRPCTTSQNPERRLPLIAEYQHPWLSPSSSSFVGLSQVLLGIGSTSLCILAFHVRVKAQTKDWQDPERLYCSCTVPRLFDSSSQTSMAYSHPNCLGPSSQFLPRGRSFVLEDGKT